jgi:3-hydroxymyristoyl/3-hydroxydecanoyl-(acyl carrier protein) dehydratase
MKFRMVDRIVAWESRRMIKGIKTLSFEEYELKERLGDEPSLPESLLMESLFQLGNWLVVLSSDFSRMGLVIRLEEVRFEARLRPGHQLKIEAVVRSWRDDGILFDGFASVDEEQIAIGCGCLATPVALADYYDPDDLRVLFSEIFRPEEAELQEVL